jgi:hypothetical protein
MRFLSQRSGKQFDPNVIQILSQFSHDELPVVSDVPRPRQVVPSNFEPAFADTDSA